MQSQVLFKNLGVDLKDIQPTSLLRDRKREIEGNPDFSNKDFGASQAQVVEMKSGLMSPLNQVELPHEVAPSSNAAGGHTHLLSQVGALSYFWNVALLMRYIFSIVFCQCFNSCLGPVCSASSLIWHIDGG